MPDKSCGNCKHCQKMIPMQEGLEPLWVCHVDWWGDVGVIVTPPNDDACQKWEEEEHENDYD